MNITISVARSKQSMRCICIGLGILLTFIVCESSVSAQMGGIDSDPGDRGTGGRATIQGSIYFPSGRRADRRLLVKLDSSNGQMTTMTDDSGAFAFHRIKSGTYRVTVETGKDYEPVAEKVDVSEYRSVRTAIIVQIHLKPRYNAETPPPSVIDANLASVPKPALDLYSQALKTSQAGNGKEAIKYLEKALSIAPQFMLAHNELGVQYMRLNQFDKAAESFRAALKLEPHVFAPRLNYGILLVRQKKFAEGDTELRRALESNEKSASAHLYAGRAEIGLSKLNEAKKHLQRAIELGGDDGILARRFLGVVYIEQGKNRYAVSELQTYLKLSPQTTDAEQIQQIITQLDKN